MAKETKATIGPDEKKWQSEADLRSLIEAQKVRSDKGRMKAALSARDEQMKALSNVGGEGKKSE